MYLHSRKKARSDLARRKYAHRMDIEVRDLRERLIDTPGTPGGGKCSVHPLGDDPRAIDCSDCLRERFVAWDNAWTDRERKMQGRGAASTHGGRRATWGVLQERVASSNPLTFCKLHSISYPIGWCCLVRTTLRIFRKTLPSLKPSSQKQKFKGPSSPVCSDFRSWRSRIKTRLTDLVLILILRATTVPECATIENLLEGKGSDGNRTANLKKRTLTPLVGVSYTSRTSLVNSPIGDMAKKLNRKELVDQSL